MEIVIKKILRFLWGFLPMTDRRQANMFRCVDCQFQHPLWFWAHLGEKKSELTGDLYTVYGGICVNCRNSEYKANMDDVDAIQVIDRTNSPTLYVKPKEPKQKAPSMREYEACFDYFRVNPPITIEREDYEEFSKVHERLNDIYFSMPGIAEALKYAKEAIHSPSNDSTWKQVLEERFIPYKTLEWNQLEVTEPHAEVPKYQCESKPFLKMNGEHWIIRIRIRPEIREENPPGSY